MAKKSKNLVLLFLFLSMTLGQDLIHRDVLLARGYCPLGSEWQSAEGVVDLATSQGCLACLLGRGYSPAQQFSLFYTDVPALELRPQAAQTPAVSPPIALQRYRAPPF